MEKKISQSKIEKHFRQSFIDGNISINDLRDKEEDGIALTAQESRAIQNFERFQLLELTQKLSNDEFHQRYKKIQILANLSPFEDFLKEEYDN